MDWRICGVAAIKLTLGDLKESSLGREIFWGERA
jgi:hypothetical protein